MKVESFNNLTFALKSKIRQKVRKTVPSTNSEKRKLSLYFLNGILK